MRNLICVGLVVMGLAACANKPLQPHYGNYVTSQAPANERIIAADVTKKLISLYPPAQTRFTLQQTTKDAFGAHLVASLRINGFAMAEFKVPPKSTAVNATSAVALAYVLDQPLGASYYRVTVHVNRHSLSRLYESKDGAIGAAGHWVWKE